MGRTRTADRWKLGWFGLAGTLALLLSSPVRALNLDDEVRRHEADAAQIRGTLVAKREVRPADGRDRHVRVRLVPRTRSVIR